jgi:transcriptional regulator with AAA-type ATPase domain
LPRSIVAWFAVCWGLFLVAALVVGGLLIALYKETTTQRTDRAAASIAVACDAIVRESRSLGETDGRTANTRYAAAVNGALEQFAGVEGGLWKTGSGSIAYAFPTYQGSGQKTDLPQAEEPTIRQVVETAATAYRPVEWKRDAGSQVLLIHACPISNAAEGIAAWTMTRVVTVGGRPFLLAVTGLAFLLVVLLGSAALLGRVLWRWSQRVRTVEAALSTGAEDLPVLPLTGQRDLDRIVGAINGAGAKASEARRRTESLLQRVADGERLATLGRVAAGVAHEIRNPIAAMRLKAENALANEADNHRIRRAVRLMRAGADDYVTKPFEVEALLRKIAALCAREITAGSDMPGRETLESSAAMRTVESELQRIKDATTPVLLSGETGVGKEVAARQLHDTSSRRALPFVVVSCATIPMERAESVMFGHERGAVAGSRSAHAGLVEQAGAGTLFLDEVSALPLALQGKFLRLLEDGTYRRVGGAQELVSNARIVSSTNADLPKLVAEEQFRSDLYYRLNTIELHLPPLRARPEDIVPLAEHLIAEIARRSGQRIPSLLPAARAALRDHPWPGNIRELRNRLERALGLADGTAQLSASA